MFGLTTLERRLCISALVCLLLVSFFYVSNIRAATNANQSPASSNASTTDVYVGADMGGMLAATGVDSANPSARPVNGPWPQRADNYCFLAVTQALVNYEAWADAQMIPYPSQTDQGPAAIDGGTLNPDFNQPGAPGTILNAMDQLLKPQQMGFNYGPAVTYTTDQTDYATGGTKVDRAPFTLANISHDYGGDPRAIATASTYLGYTYEKVGFVQHIYHNGNVAATQGLVNALEQQIYPDNNTPGNTVSMPALAFIHSALHVVVVAGAFLNGSTIDSLVIYDSWDQKWLSSYGGSYYEVVSYNDWLTNPMWFASPYKSNGAEDPDPYIGPYAVAPNYQAGVDSYLGPLSPTLAKKHHWITNYVTIQPTPNSASVFASPVGEDALNENGNVMTGP